MSSEQMQPAIQELQETVVVMAHIEKTQSQPFIDRSETLRLGTDRNLAEIADKLNHLIR